MRADRIGPHPDTFDWIPSAETLSTSRYDRYAPLGMVMGTCVYHIAHRSIGQTLGNAGQNVELPQFTEALYDARELAMSRMQAEAEQLQAEGVVGVQLLSLPHRWGGHTTEFFTIGTAVHPLRADHIIAKPTMVLPLTD
jgi:uncharacterized protein YbjQ (UPF0145 family)